MENFVMIEEETRVELNPYALNDSEKASANNDNTIYICKCCYPQKELKYHFSSDL